MVMCFVYGCNNSKNRTAPNKIYCRIPKEIAKQCYIIAKRQDIDRGEFLSHSHKQYRICNDHFDDSDYSTNHLGKYLNKNATPYRYGPPSKVSD